MEKNFSVQDIGLLADLLKTEDSKGKYFAGKDLGLTGCEVSVNCLPAGTGVPFVHAHKQNEELYIFVRGEGVFYIDGKEFPVREGSLVRVAPEGERACKAGAADLYYICIQTQAGSLQQATFDDGVRKETKSSWMK